MVTLWKNDLKVKEGTLILKCSCFCKYKTCILRTLSLTHCMWKKCIEIQSFHPPIRCLFPYLKHIFKVTFMIFMFHTNVLYSPTLVTMLPKYKFLVYILSEYLTDTHIYIYRTILNVRSKSVT